MAVKSFTRTNTAPLQVVELRPISNPAEIAAFEEKVRLWDEIERAARRRDAIELLKDPTVAEALKLARRLSATEQVEFIPKLVYRLPEDKRVELLNQATTSSRNGARRHAAANSKKALKSV
jgi:hypothetical protein